MRRKTWLGACRVMQLMESRTGGLAASNASLAHARATACTVSVLPAVRGTTYESGLMPSAHSEACASCGQGLL